MNYIDYYAGERELVRLNEPPRPADVFCSLNVDMLRYVVQEHADCPPPFKLHIHRDVLWNLIKEGLPKELFDLEVHTEELGARPLGKAVIDFKSCDVAIYYRRSLVSSWTGIICCCSS